MKGVSSDCQGVCVSSAEKLISIWIRRATSHRSACTTWNSGEEIWKILQFYASSFRCRVFINTIRNACPTSPSPWLSLPWKSLQSSLILRQAYILRTVKNLFEARTPSNYEQVFTPFIWFRRPLLLLLLLFFLPLRLFSIKSNCCKSSLSVMLVLYSSSKHTHNCTRTTHING